MRHVSRTLRVALDWMFDRINLDPKIQIRYIDTKNQLADILTKRKFTRDEWNHMLTLFNISHFSSTACIAAMAKRAQQGSGEERVTAKSRPTVNLTARAPSFVFFSLIKPAEDVVCISRSWKICLKEVVDEARTSGVRVHFASLMDICHLKNAELEAKHEKYKGRVVFRGDNVKDNSGSYAVFIEQGSSTSQMTAAKIVNIISILLGCDGQSSKRSISLYP